MLPPSLENSLKVRRIALQNRIYPMGQALQAVRRVQRSPPTPGLPDGASAIGSTPPLHPGGGTRVRDETLSSNPSQLDCDDIANTPTPTRIPFVSRLPGPGGPEALQDPPLPLGEDGVLPPVPYPSTPLDQSAAVEHDATLVDDRDVGARVLGSVALALQDDDTQLPMCDRSIRGLRPTVVLLQHQKSGIAWMRDRESGIKKGGIVADEMGLGKTVLGITRILDNPPTPLDRPKGWSKATLVVCPVAVLKQWKSEIAKFAIGLRVVDHCGQSRQKVPVVLQEANVVLTTYETLTSEYAVYSLRSPETGRTVTSQHTDNDTNGDAEKGGQGQCLLFKLSWWRVILDEAHRIKTYKSKGSIACSELTAKYRWCFTGTPIQNSVDELFSFFRFLKVRPLADRESFNHYINRPIKAGHTRVAIRRLQTVLKVIMLRRCKVSPLPSRQVQLTQCHFDREERDFYDMLEGRYRAKAVEMMSKGGPSSPMTSILEMILRLRQACVHPALLSPAHQDSEAIARASSSPEPLDFLIQYARNFSQELDVLLNELYPDQDRTCTSCKAPLPKLPPTKAVRCKRCGTMVEASTTTTSEGAGLAPLPRQSAKVTQLLICLREIDERSRSQEKTIIFSHFTTMLDIIQKFLDADGIVFTRYDGSMSNADRESSLDVIRNSTTTRCILISIAAGGLGLNLTECNNVILLEPWWNPALEEQAFGRVDRIGQALSVNIYKLIVPGTVEERILELQAEKRLLAQETLSCGGVTHRDTSLHLEDVNRLLKL